MIYSCSVFGISRQGYYKRQQAVKEKQNLSCDVLTKVQSIRLLMPRIGTRKLCHMLGADLNIGRDKLFAILRANRMLVYTKKCVTRPRTLNIGLGSLKIGLKS